MDTKPQSSNQECLVEIEQAIPNEEDKRQKTQDRSTKLMEQINRRIQPSFSRQVSLETGVSTRYKDTNESDSDKIILSRTGKSFGGFAAAAKDRHGKTEAFVSVVGGSGDERKREFSMFRTKSSINRHNMSGGLENNVDPERVDGEESLEERPSNSVPNVKRYFAALKGPELDEVKENEKILLPTDELWPFLLRFPINSFGICLGLASQSILWGILAKSPATEFLGVSPQLSLIIWLLALCVFIAVTTAYVLKCAFFFEAVRREFYHPVRVNFFFSPWLICMFLANGVPPKLTSQPMSPIIWCICMAPVFCLDLKIYGQWLSGGKRRISKVVNPSSHMAVVGNFVGAILACKVGWKEAARFFWGVGLAHYLVVFVTLYQRLPSNEALPKELHPVYSMFIATPSAASIAWGAIHGEFDSVSKTFYFIALFLYLSLVVRVNFFWGFKFSVAWWAYSFPMTTATVATIKYAEVVPTVLTKGLVVILTVVSTTIVSLLVISTILHGFVLHSLFPNDPAIAITDKKTINDWKAKPFSSKEKKHLNLKSAINQSPEPSVSFNAQRQQSSKWPCTRR